MTKIVKIKKPVKYLTGSFLYIETLMMRVIVFINILKIKKITYIEHLMDDFLLLKHFRYFI